jgi:hypothetical protein
LLEPDCFHFCFSPQWHAVSVLTGIGCTSTEEKKMAYTTIGKIGRGLALAGGFAAAVGLSAAPVPAQAGIGPGAAVGIGLGAFALGSAIGAAGNPYYYGGYPYGYYAQPAYPYYGPGYGPGPYYYRGW